MEVRGILVAVVTCMTPPRSGLIAWMEEFNVETKVTLIDLMSCRNSVAANGYPNSDYYIPYKEHQTHINRVRVRLVGWLAAYKR